MSTLTSAPETLRWLEAAKREFGPEYEVASEYIASDLSWLVYAYDPAKKQATAIGGKVDAFGSVEPAEFWKAVHNPESLLKNRLK